jgi:hypothetical protein
LVSTPFERESSIDVDSGRKQEEWRRINGIYERDKTAVD